VTFFVLQYTAHNTSPVCSFCHSITSQRYYR